jgi:AraC-like DNA-binding protein
MPAPSFRPARPAPAPHLKSAPAPAADSSRGILNPGAEGRCFRLTRLAPAASVAAVIDRYWCVRWDFAPNESYLTETLPFPCVNVVFEPGASAVNGIWTRGWSRSLLGSGRVFGVKFRPGAFAPFFSRPIHELTDRVLPWAQLFGAEGSALESALLADEEDEQRARRFEGFLAPRMPPPDPDRSQVTDIVEFALASPGLCRVADLARAVGLPARSLQRLFRRYLGVTPKWTLRRFRMQEAAQRVAQGGRPDWAELAIELGYFDQAHFASDFKAQLGKTPTEYAALTRAPAH